MKSLILAGAFTILFNTQFVEARTVLGGWGEYNSSTGLGINCEGTPEGMRTNCQSVGVDVQQARENIQEEKFNTLSPEQQVQTLDQIEIVRRVESFNARRIQDYSEESYFSNASSSHQALMRNRMMLSLGGVNDGHNYVSTDNLLSMQRMMRGEPLTPQQQEGARFAMESVQRVESELESQINSLLLAPEEDLTTAQKAYIRMRPDKYPAGTIVEFQQKREIASRICVIQEGDQVCTSQVGTFERSQNERVVLSQEVKDVTDALGAGTPGGSDVTEVEGQ